MEITITVNGEKEQINAETSISQLLTARNIRPEVVTVELNDEIIQRDRYPGILLKAEDRVEFVFYMGGGQHNGKVADSVLELIGNTPMVRLNKLVEPDMAEIIAKLESYNPGGSVKDRICLSMIEDAEKKGILKPGSTVIEPTSGNTGIGLAVVCCVKGYRCILAMPETMSPERVFILKAHGAEVILTPGIDGMLGAIRKAEELAQKIPDSFIPQQFKNAANPEIHRQTTVKEILATTEGNIDAFIAGVGTGGTITGVGQILKEADSEIKIIAVEPKASAVLSGHKPGPHRIQGIGAGFVPQVLDLGVIDEIIQVDDSDAYKTSRRLAKEEGLFVGISAGAATHAALQVAKLLGKGKKLVVMLQDSGERYLSMEQYFAA